MKKTLGSILIVVLVVVGIILLVQSNKKESIEGLGVPQEAAVASALGTEIPVDFIDSVPDCINSVGPAANGGCYVNTCSGAVYVGTHNFSYASVNNCVDEDSWDGWDGGYSGEEWGCLANECLNHGVDIGDFSDMISQADFSRKSVSDEDVTNIDSIPYCIESVSANGSEGGSSCTVQTCDDGYVVGNGALSTAQISQCTGSDTIPADPSYTQLGCLASECINYTSMSPVEQTTEAFDYIKKFDTFTNGSQNPVVFLIESQLKERGYFSGNPDMILDMMAIQGIRKFQTDNKLQSTGRLDNKTLEYLFFR